MRIAADGLAVLAERHRHKQHTVGSYRAMMDSRFGRHNRQHLANNQYRLHRRPIITPTATVLVKRKVILPSSFLLCAQFVRSNRLLFDYDFRRLFTHIAVTNQGLRRHTLWNKLPSADSLKITISSLLSCRSQASRCTFRSPR